MGCGAEPHVNYFLYNVLDYLKASAYRIIAGSSSFSRGIQSENVSTEGLSISANCNAES